MNIGKPDTMYHHCKCPVCGNLALVEKEREKENN